MVLRYHEYWLYLMATQDGFVLNEQRFKDDSKRINKT